MSDSISRRLNATNLDSRTKRELRNLLSNNEFFVGENLGSISAPTIGKTFDQIVAGIEPTYEHLFGTDVRTSRPYQTAIRNLTDLAVHYNPHQDFTGTISINSEVQRYQTFNSSNHVFNSDRLTLTALLPDGAWPTITITASGRSGSFPVDGATAVPIADMGLATTAGIYVGQLVAALYEGAIFRVTAVVADTSVTFAKMGGSGTTYSAKVLMQFLPIFVARPSGNLSTGQGYTTVTVDALPGGVTTGMSIGFLTGSAALMDKIADWRVQEINGNVVTSTLPMNLLNAVTAASGWVVFYPYVTSGQIWSKRWMPFNDPHRTIALMFDLDVLPGADASYDIRLISSLSAYNAIPADSPIGAWGAEWIYQAEDGTGATTNNSEIDIEHYWSLTEGPRTLNLGNINATSTDEQLYQRRDNGYSWGSSTASARRNQSFNGPLRVSILYHQGRVYKHASINGEPFLLVHRENFKWTSQREAQFGINLAMGSFSGAFSSNFMLPRSPSSFNLAKHSIKNVKVWVVD